jgi:TolB-like protein/class 3 adenylate cyclase/Flp pilus assembly protein TadD
MRKVTDDSSSVDDGAKSSLKRRLAAIAFADVASFARLMSIDEARTLRAWKALRGDILEPYTIAQGGRVVEIAGDALLIEFPSAIDAVRWAIDVQRAVKGREDAADELSLNLRIGINVDDVVVNEDGSINAEGVNVAARIHHAAAPGEIAITSVVRDFVVNRLPIAVRDLGTPPLKNISRPVHVFAIQGAESGKSESAYQPYLQWSTRPTIAVLPLRNISGSTEESYFGEGITEDIITGLSRSRAFYVISRTSTLRYRDRDKDLRQIAAELDVRYILDGSVRRMAGGLRINAELIDVDPNRPVWAERFDGSNEDLFSFQDQIVARIVGSLESRVQAVEVARVRDRPTTSLDAYDCVLIALSQLYQFTDESFRISGQTLDRAIRIDPHYAQAHAYAAWRLNFRVGEGRSEDSERDKKLALELSQRAIELDPDDAFALAVSGHLLSFFAGRSNEALERFENALALDENSAFAWGLSALTKAYLGQADEALEQLRNVWQLSPFDPLNFYYWIVAGIAEFVAGRYPEAVSWLQKSARANPRFIACQRMLTASLAQSGNVDAARSAAQHLMHTNPGFRVGQLLKWYPLARPEDLHRFEDGLRKAGLP